MTTPQIAVWGATEVGKTMYLAGSMLALATFHPEWSWLMGKGPLQERTFEFINEEMGKLQGGRLAQATDPTKEPDRYLFQLQQQGDLLGRRGRYHEVILIDVAGIHTEDPNDTYRYFETLRSCQGILMLIDPNLKSIYQAPSPAKSTREITYFALFQLLIKHLQETHAHGARLSVPVAVCLTKIDQDEHWPYRERPQEYLREMLGAPAFNLLTSTFTSREFFAVSTVGRFRDSKTGEEKSNLDPHPDRNHLLDVKAWQPYRLLDPLFWLLDNLEWERDRRLPWWRQTVRRLVREPNYKR